uniref:Uncharacterized protein n=1 Tax=Ciona intestinalis TaxID=7719 RepID=H2XRJ9_CIOIN
MKNVITVVVQGGLCSDFIWKFLTKFFNNKHFFFEFEFKLEM